jgi:hypothetical protein
MFLHVIERIFDMFKTALALAAFALFAAGSAASASDEPTRFVMSGKLGDIDKEFSTKLTEGMASVPGISDEMKLRILSAGIENCTVDIDIDVRKVETYFLKQATSISCPSGDKMEATFHRTSNGIYQAVGKPEVRPSAFKLNTLSGWRNLVLVMNYGKMGGHFPTGLRLQFEMANFTPKVVASR